MDKSKFLFLFGSLLLICLICLLSSIDSTGYIRCHYADAGEFSKYSKNLNQIPIAVINKRAKQLPLMRECPLFVSLHIFSKYIKPCKHQKTMCSSPEKKNNILTYRQENIFPTTGNYQPFQTLQILNTSIIRS